MVNDGKFLWADIPENFPDISVLNYTEAQLDDLKGISLVDAIQEARRRHRVRANTRRAEMREYAKQKRDRNAAMNEATETPQPIADISSVTATGASSQPAATGSPTSTPIDGYFPLERHP